MNILVENYTDIYGTVRLNRKNLLVGIKREVSAYAKDKMMVLKWKDKTCVTALNYAQC